MFAPLQAEGDLYALQHEHISTGSREALREASLNGLAATYAAAIIKELVRRNSSSTECTDVPDAPTIRRVSDESASPYVLIGASFGSFLAHHIAVAAGALGRPPAGLVQIDPWPVPPLLWTRGRRLLLRLLGVPRDRKRVCALSTSLNLNCSHLFHTHLLHTCWPLFVPFLSSFLSACPLRCYLCRHQLERFRKCV